MMEMVTIEMNKFKFWFDSNKLSLNLNKTKFMVFVIIYCHTINTDVRLVTKQLKESMKVNFWVLYLTI